jgi:hypothetical protein
MHVKSIKMFLEFYNKLNDKLITFDMKNYNSLCKNKETEIYLFKKW